MRNLILLSEKYHSTSCLLNKSIVQATFTKSPTDNKTYFLTSDGEIFENNEVLLINYIQFIESMQN